MKAKRDGVRKSNRAAATPEKLQELRALMGWQLFCHYWDGIQSGAWNVDHLLDMERAYAVKRAEIEAQIEAEAQMIAQKAAADGPRRSWWGRAS